MDKDEIQGNTALPKKADTPRCADMLATALTLLHQCLHDGQCDIVPDELQQVEEFAAMLHDFQLIQKHIFSMARGKINEPIPLGGHTGNLLKELQSALQQVVLKARRCTVGDFSSDVGNMGEISEAFDVMGKTLQSALTRLERQKDELMQLSLNLQREVDARIHVEANLRLEQIRLQKLASTDSLTGLANRRYFFQIAVREIERIRRTGSKACLAMLDIDHFKKLNDSFGHSAGDKALYQIVHTISSLIRPYDLVGRYGGDEFIFLFPETGVDVTYMILERLRDSIEQAHITVGQGDTYITVSIGLTEIDTSLDSSDSALDYAIARADEALYKAKGHSRNYICVV